MGFVRAIAPLANLQRVLACLVLALAFQSNAAAEQRNSQSSHGDCSPNIISGGNVIVVCKQPGRSSAYRCRSWQRQRGVWEYHMTYEPVSDEVRRTYRLPPYENESHECL